MSDVVYPKVKVPSPVESVSLIVNGLGDIAEGVGNFMRYSKNFNYANDLADYFFLVRRIAPDIIAKFKDLEEFKTRPFDSDKNIAKPSHNPSEDRKNGGTYGEK